jgi:hypothetical protein
LPLPLPLLLTDSFFVLLCHVACFRESQELQNHQRRYLLPQNQSHFVNSFQIKREELKSFTPSSPSPHSSSSSSPLPELPASENEEKKSQSSSSSSSSSKDQYEFIQSRAKSISQRIYDRYNTTPSSNS